jgi:uncharacterized protein
MQIWKSEGEMARLDDLIECLIVNPMDLDRVKELAAGLDLSEQHEKAGTALMFATGRGVLPTVQLLLNLGANPNDTHRALEMTALHLACSGGFREIAEELLSHSASLEARDNQGWTPLMFAAQEGQLSCVELLLERGAQVDAADLTGRTALMQAARCGHLSIAEKLIEAGADVNAQSGWATTLIVAATAGTTSLGELLIAQGAVIDQLDLKEGYSALMMAAISGHVDFARMLIAQGADVNLTTEWNVSAATMALRGGNEELQRLLREAGAAEPKPVPLPVMFPYGWVGDPILVQQLQRIQRG